LENTNENKPNTASEISLSLSLKVGDKFKNKSGDVTYIIDDIYWKVYMDWRTPIAKLNIICIDDFNKCRSILDMNLSDFKKQINLLYFKI